MKIKKNIIRKTINPVRHRTRGMPSFPRNKAAAPDITAANIDKLKIKIKRAFVVHFDNYDDLKRFKAQLAKTDLFSQGYKVNSGRFTIKGAKRKKRWLFGGTLLVRKVANENSVVIELDLELNPTRFIHHAIRNHGEVDDVSAWLRSMRRANPINILERSLDLGDEEKSLDGQDNFIPARQYAQMRPAKAFLDVYIAKVIEFISQTIQQQLRRPTRQFEEHMTDWTVIRAEVYWEYAVSNAPAFVYNLRGFLAPMFSESSIIEYPIDDFEKERPHLRDKTERNSPFLLMHAGRKGIQYAVYAKEMDRVRFEVRYSGNLQRAIDAKGISGESSLNVSKLMRPAIEDARVRLNRVFAELPDLDYSERSDFQSFIEAMGAVGNALAVSGIADEIIPAISLMFVNGKIEAQKGTSLDIACHELKKSGVLIRTKAGKNSDQYLNYVVHPHYHSLTGAIGRIMRVDAAYRRRNGRKG